jgi:hypothetical protein
VLLLVVLMGMGGGCQPSLSSVVCRVMASFPLWKRAKFCFSSTGDNSFEDIVAGDQDSAIERWLIITKFVWVSAEEMVAGNV